eukprot:CAMPEP_0197175934 /NCGR_PEP_ID=MMETSP1423-20130617/2015_1 /TAXON_ID=476441 /ORGANISM="Pseudo-nitzschia heimii, Strain UNC1101" /LENGTH=78 /DNA_ID=CAMNT_0042625203 /DNA_START=1044 /DNA_END=1280 /DNA_ORIENTATION=-
MDEDDHACGKVCIGDAQIAEAEMAVRALRTLNGAPVCGVEHLLGGAHVSLMLVWHVGEERVEQLIERRPVQLGAFPGG